eukprot:g74486.t1
MCSLTISRFVVALVCLECCCARPAEGEEDIEEEEEDAEGEEEDAGADADSDVLKLVLVGELPTACSAMHRARVRTGGATSLACLPRLPSARRRRLSI